MPERTGTQAAGTLPFALLCLVWGSTWLSLKIGVSTVPPITFAAARFLGAALLLLPAAAIRGRISVPAATLFPGAVLMIAVNYGLMAWGITRVSSGLASVINLSTIPMVTLVVSVAYRQARWTSARAAALLLGAAGLGMLFTPDVAARETIGMIAIAVGAACYAWGGVLIKEQASADAIALAGWQSLVGGGLLAATALFAEPFDRHTFMALGAPAALANLAFLVLGSVIGGSIYLMLLARWDAARVATYAYVCPLIALAEGAVLEDRWPRGIELVAVILLLAAIRLTVSCPAQQPLRGERE